ncbi:NAD(P)-dependent oxidoreductase [Terracoccus sp. 273MFTsu3.1]|uniref:NAD-dependent epimerase/dehydratase family protein n=1 Tax=Terracoccus sp. 273MFTsu3.1 TaxID=1172188 RepID=UPI0021015C77|nr:NAD-dependent epimerase/dehydratase family protein [Terracoccus sp. 273MFTsu3.1]
MGDHAWHRLDGARVLITGGTGFVGKWLLATALHATRSLEVATELVLLSRDPRAFARANPELASGLTLLPGDVRDFEPAPGEFTHVVHAATDVVATHEPMETFDVTVRGTQRVLEVALARGARDVLLVSSGAVYGPQPTTMPTISESYLGAPPVVAPGSAYGEGKRVAEWLTHLAAADGLQARVARCFAFVGPHLALDQHFAIGNFIADAMAGRPIEVRGDGTDQRSYLHAADMAGWLWAMLLRSAAGTTYNVGGPEAVSLADLAHRVNSVLGSDAGVVVGRRPDRGTPGTRYVPDVSAIRRDLGLPEPIPVDEAIARTAAWHRGRAGS